MRCTHCQNKISTGHPTLSIQVYCKDCFWEAGQRRNRLEVTVSEYEYMLQALEREYPYIFEQLQGEMFVKFGIIEQAISKAEGRE